MHKFILKRIITMIPVLLGVSLVIFTMVYFTPGDAADMILGDSATPAERELMREQLRLNDGYFIQYFNYIKNVVIHGDFGTSYVTKQPVTVELIQRFPTTLKLAGLSILVAVIVGITTGIISATRQYSIFDTISTVVALFGVSMPSFWWGLMLILFFSVNLGWFPPSGFATPAAWVLPVITVGTNTAATIMRMTRSSMLEVVRQDYIRTARAKGQKESIVICKHALGNALIPVITTIGLSFGRLLGGVVLVESIFSIAGIGKLMVDAIKMRNAPMVQGGVLFIAIVTCIVNLLVDILYAYVDPRIRSQYVKTKTKKQSGRASTKGESSIV